MAEKGLVSGAVGVGLDDGVACPGCREEHEFCTCALSGPEGLLGEVTVNGEPLLLGRMRFSKPCGFRHLLNPFARVLDKSGREYSVRRFSDKARIIASVKKGEPLDVLYRPTESGFELVRLGLDWIF